jgi:lysophospholipase L1-like esterase
MAPLDIGIGVGGGMGRRHGAVSTLSPVEQILSYSAPSYEGFVGTKGLIPNTVHSTNTQIMAETRHFMRAAVSTFKLVFCNFYINGSGVEVDGGSSCTVTASVSTSRAGPWTRVQFSGVDAGSISAGAILVSDAVSFPLSDGDEFFVRSYKVWSGSGRALYEDTEAGQSANGNLFRIGTSVTDSTGGGAFTGNANNFWSGPCAVVGETTKASILEIGDSISYGYNDEYISNADIGFLSRTFGPSLGYAKISRASDTAQAFVASNGKRLLLKDYASHVVCNYGINDISSGRTGAELKSDIETIAALFTQPFYESTITPKTTSTDSWATLVNQTIFSGNTERGNYNDALRAGSVSGVDGVFDPCAVLEDDYLNNGGKWAVGLTDDGLHPDAEGHAAAALYMTSGA